MYSLRAARSSLAWVIYEFLLNKPIAINFSCHAVICTIGRAGAFVAMMRSTQRLSCHARCTASAASSVGTNAMTDGPEPETNAWLAPALQGFLDRLSATRMQGDRRLLQVVLDRHLPAPI